MGRIADTVFQFKITLRHIRPPIWRRIQVPAAYSFWDLHVAIQDGMGWLDYHLHEFLIRAVPGRPALHIGIPDDAPLLGDIDDLPGWEIPVRKYLGWPKARALYTYDFGDDWEHDVVLEKVLPRTPRVRYPVCVAGRRHRPPEDVGGPGGYLRFLEAIRDPEHEEHESCLEWVGGSFDPEAFSPAEVVFDNPAERFKVAFE